MKPRFLFWTVSLVAVLLTSACASTVTNTPVAMPTVDSIPATAAPEATATAASGVDVQVVPTSRGPNLESTDPTTVSLASGQLQLVEFFRFT